MQNKVVNLLVLKHKKSAATENENEQKMEKSLIPKKKLLSPFSFFLFFFGT
jgi:hypothetical protein